jgi:hypothetical protein
MYFYTWKLYHDVPRTVTQYSTVPVNKLSSPEVDISFIGGVWGVWGKECLPYLRLTLSPPQPLIRIRSGLSIIHFSAQTAPLPRSFVKILLALSNYIS